MVMTIAIYIDYMILYDDGDDNKLMVMVRIIMMMVMITMMIMMMKIMTIATCKLLLEVPLPLPRPQILPRPSDWKFPEKENCSFCWKF